ncbi:MAG: histidine kinase dimerization/phospho-acceptor domain-containing protein [Acidobacteriota bacterium]
MELGGAGAAVLSVDEQRRVVRAAGWEKVNGCPPPTRIPAPDEAEDDLMAQIAEALDEATQCGRPARRLAAVELERRRYYAIAAGRTGSNGQGHDAAVVLFEVPNAFRVRPREGEEIRQLGHDLRTPLTSMSGAVELLRSGRMGSMSPEQGRLLKMLERGIDMMLTLIDKATHDYRLAAGKIRGNGRKAPS